MAEPNNMEVVISGISGIFPECDNIEELKDLLFNKQNGITLDSKRWTLGEINIILHSLNNIVTSNVNKKHDYQIVCSS